MKREKTNGKYFFPLSPTVSLRSWAIKLYINSEINCILDGIIERGLTVRVRKRVIATDGPDIPYPRVRVEWIDCVSDSGWATDKEFDRMKFAKPINEGWLYSKDKQSIKLFASYDKDEDGFTFGDRTMIPRAWVKKIQKI